MPAEDSEKFDFVEWRRRFFNLRSDPLVATSANEVLTLIANAVNLRFGKPSSYAEMCDLAAARKLFHDKVLNFKVGGGWGWLHLVHDIASHHPKTQNDKVSSGGVIAESPSSPGFSGCLTSFDLTSGRNFSGAGNATFSTHYLLLTLPLAITGPAKSLIEHVADDNSLLRNALIDLGLRPEEWDRLNVACKKRLIQKQRSPIDRQVKQIFIPYPSGGKQHTLVSPVPSTRLIAAVEKLRSEMMKDKVLLPTRVTKVGGANPQNAGPLLADLGGKIRHLDMSFPKFSLSETRHSLFRVSRNPFFISKRDSQVLKLKTLLAESSTEFRAKRQTYQKAVQNIIDRVVSSRMEKLIVLKDSLASLEDSSLPSRTEWGEQFPERTWLQDYLYPERGTMGLDRVKSEMEHEALRKLLGALPTFGDFEAHLLKKSVRNYFERVVL